MNNPIAIVTAMPSEKFDFPNCLSLSTGIGHINATYETTKFLSEHKVSFVLNIGVVGSHDKNLHVGDIIVIDKVFNGSNFITDATTGKPTLMDWKSGEEDLSAEGLKLDQTLIDNFKNYADINNINYTVGNIYSSGAWNRKKEDIEFFHKKYNTLCEDMESYAIKFVCDKFNVPMLSIKIISNNELIDESYDRNVVKKLHKIVGGFLSSGQGNGENTHYHDNRHRADRGL